MPTDERGGTRDVPPLVSAHWLRARLDDPQVLAVEASEDAWTYYAGHVPGAVVLDWYDHLHRPGQRGALDPQGFAELLGGRGITPDTHVVLYGDSGNTYAGYAYWLLRYHRHRRVSLLDGGRAVWLEQGGPLSEAVPTRPACAYRSPGPDAGLRVLREEVLRRFVQPPEDRRLLDCRRPEVYAGARGPSNSDLPLPGSGLAGHVPGAVNVPSAAVVHPGTGRFLPPEQLRGVFTAAGVVPGREVALYCGAGAESSLPWFALSEILGHAPARLYEGGWVEYSNLVAAPTVLSPLP